MAQFQVNREVITINYRPLIKGNQFHIRTIHVTTDELYGIILMAHAFREMSTSQIYDISIQFANGEYADVARADALPYFGLKGYTYDARFMTVKVSFDNIEVLQGAVQVCLLFGVDPTTAITNAHHNGNPTEFDFGRYFGIITLSNPSTYPDGTALELEAFRPLMVPELSESLEETLAECFPGVDLGIMVPSEFYYVATNSARTNVAASCVVSRYLPEAVSHYAGAYYISNVCAGANFRGQGLAKSVMVCMLNNLLNQGVNRFLLEVDVTNTVAYTLYLSLGFNKVASVTEDDKTYDVLLLSLE